MTVKSRSRRSSTRVAFQQHVFLLTCSIALNSRDGFFLVHKLLGWMKRRSLKCHHSSCSGTGFCQANHDIKKQTQLAAVHGECFQTPQLIRKP